MNKYHLVVITGYGIMGDQGTASFTVKADDFDHGPHGCYRFFNYIERPNYSGHITVAMYPINRTIIHRIEEID